IYSSITNFSYKKIEKLYQGKGYGDFKSDLAELVGNELKEIQTKYQEIISSEQLNIILNKGRERANFLGNKKIAKVYKKVGLGR
ncbi:MAG: tryptophan--tRNA ligase, partial [Bacilli bacterium]|nr:tryptophan--tRNA ligase [Bacilli bacterium]